MSDFVLKRERVSELVRERERKKMHVLNIAYVSVLLDLVNFHFV